MCVCVCVRERERERELLELMRITYLCISVCLSCVLLHYMCVSACNCLFGYVRVGVNLCA